jgi:hypothetical protein
MPFVDGRCLFQGRLELIGDLAQVLRPIFCQSINEGDLTPDFPGNQFRAFG